MAELKKARTPAQQANDEKLGQMAVARRAGTATVSSRQSFLARHGRLAPKMTVENEEDLQVAGEDMAGPARPRGAVAGQITVEHVTDEKVKMWKRGPHGWTPREVPVHGIASNLEHGWMEYCPDCGGTDCGIDPNTCPGKNGKRFIACPVVTANGTPCGKRIYATGVSGQVTETGDPLEVTGIYNLDPTVELKAKMDLHLMTFHRDEARALGLFGGGQAPPRVGMEVRMEPQAAPA